MQKIHLIGNAHLDPVWLWKKSEGLSEIKSTFRSALDRMNEFPNYIFTSACAMYYEWVEKIDPEMFEEIKQRVNEGRWNIVGGMWIQPDCNMPSGESFARHALYSQRYFYEKFGKMATAGYNVDSFGHNGMLPQLLLKSRMDSYIYQRPSFGEKPDLKDLLFHWESPDGSRVLTHHLPFSYGDWYNDSFGDDAVFAKIKDMEYFINNGEFDIQTVFYGIGNHGGGPSVSILKKLEELLPNRDDVIYSSVTNYFNDVHENIGDFNIPVVKGDLQHHASGCYSALSHIKKLNRRSENAIVKAEKLNILAGKLVNIKSEQANITDAWKKIMFNQFHDILAGCCIKDAYIDAYSSYSAAIDTAYDISEFAMQKISWNIKTTRILDDSPCCKNGWSLWEKDGEGAPVVIFNPHSFPVEYTAQVNNVVKSIVDVDGNPLHIQNIRGQQTNGGDKYNTVFNAQVPAFGYSTYYLYGSIELEPKTNKPYVNATESCLENNLIRVEFDSKTGYIKSYFDKESSKELCGGFMAKPVVIEDSGNDTWSHDVFTFNTEIGSFGDAEFEIISNGGVCAGLRVISKYNDSVLVSDFKLCPDSKQLDISCVIKFNEKLKIVKLYFDTNIKNPLAAYSMPYGFITKITDGCEEPAQEWMGIFDNDSGEGIALLNDCKYSFNADNNRMGMIAVRTAIYADHYGQAYRDSMVEYMDMDPTEFKYSILPYSQNNVSNVVKAAAVLNLQPSLIAETHHDGELPSLYTGINVSAENVIISALKYSENGKGYIVRMFETAGISVDADIDINFMAKKNAVSMKPHEIKTLFIPFDNGKIVETDFVEL